MIRKHALAIAMSAVIGAVFLLNWTDAEWIGPATAHAQPSGTPSPAGTPVPVDPGTGQNPPPCPPASYRYANIEGHPVDVTYVCSNYTAKTVSMPAGDTFVFDRDSDQQCSGCNQDDDCVCVECGLVRLIIEGETAFTCQMQQAYVAAYGLDLAKATVDTAIPLDISEPQYYEGKYRIVRWTVPVLDAERNLVGWETSPVEPDFTIEDNEIVIRAKTAWADVKDGELIRFIDKREVIGGPEGITLGKKK